MTERGTGRPLAIVTGAAGQDGQYLVKRLMEDGLVARGTVRPGGTKPTADQRASDSLVVIQELDLEQPAGLVELIAALQPDELQVELEAVR